MRHARRSNAERDGFAWPPTREDLERIEVVDPNTLRRVRASWDEPESQLPVPVPTELLKAVAPVRPRPAPFRRIDLRRRVWSVVTFRPARRRRWFDSGWLMATSGVVAVALSAYLSLRGEPSGAGRPSGTIVAHEEQLPALIARAVYPVYAAEIWQHTSRVDSPVLPSPASQPPRPARRAPVRVTTKAAPARTSMVPARTSTAPIRLASASRPVAETPKPLLASRATAIPTAVPVTVPATVPVTGEALAALPEVSLPPPKPVESARAVVPAEPGRARQLIYATLHEYERGYDQLDAKAVRAVWPSVDAQALARAFRDLKSQKVVFDRCDINVAHVRATAACRGRATYETRVGEQASFTEPREWTFTLQQHNEAWQILSATAR